MSVGEKSRIFGLSDWIAWVDRVAKDLFGMTWTEFEAAYKEGTFDGSGPARDLASMLQLVHRLRRRGEGVDAPT